MPVRTLSQQYFRGASYGDQLKIELLGASDEDYEDWQVSFETLLEGSPPALGFSILFHPAQCYIQYLAFATSSRIIVIKVPDTEKGIQSLPHDSNYDVLCSVLSGKFPDLPPLVGFDFIRAALGMHREGSFRIRGLELAPILYPKRPFSLPGFIIATLFKGQTVGRKYESVFRRPPVEDNEEDKTPKESEWVALRAWMSVVAAEKQLAEVNAARPLDTDPTEELGIDDLDALADIQYQYDLLESSAPEERRAEVTSLASRETGTIDISNAAYKSKIRRGTQQTVIFEDTEGHRIESRAQISKGKVTRVVVDKSTSQLRATEEENAESNTVIKILGRDDLTTADVARLLYMQEILQRTRTLRASNFTRILWFPTEDDLERLQKAGGKEKPKDDDEDASQDLAEEKEEEEEEDIQVDETLNPSQTIVAKTMLSERNPFALVHGPPGTGKTRTIAAVVKSWLDTGKPVYLVCQSNVGVKNIAEALAKNEILNFKLIVSSDFYEEWHEHIYEKCKPNLVQSDDFKEKGMVRKLFQDVPIILSTINMLYNASLAKGGLFDMVPVERLVVDEASQIFIGDYMALFYKFRDSLKKVCWFGDPKQLPPHQREQIDGLKSIYDVNHVCKNSLLLDTQYRMPCPIGQFISGERYEDKLKSHHAITDLDCLRFVDVDIGEETKDGTSWINLQEAETVAELVKNYYKDLDFCVITPYDSQRKLIEKVLEDQALPGNGRCFNVDSFQGNEAPYIIISTVRTDAPGFLELNNRVNVMLTRCKAGMVIVSNRRFVNTVARQTLVGKLSIAWIRNREGQEDLVWTTVSHVKKGIADMPGKSRGPRRPLTPPRQPIESPDGFQFASKPKPRGWKAPTQQGPETSTKPAWGSKRTPQGMPVLSRVQVGVPAPKAMTSPTPRVAPKLPTTQHRPSPATRNALNTNGNVVQRSAWIPPTATPAVRIIQQPASPWDNTSPSWGM